MKKKLFAIFGPVVLAFGLLALFFTSSYRVNIDNPEVNIVFQTKLCFLLHRPLVHLLT